ncbi:MAG: hypothetical protein KJ904_08680 [Alphaproteobacteria bacterium]|nr:hypothetical protein [Alphaproteobacteria bacterium]MBU0798971.1 hypothetical protein [Alphaproteobacteria bacterium]MBU0887226.1 hypothetical protein [Alphaproteobacteria bacterium]MBU1812246.1 hypothetical protein [Alphaproteobacteria bacterium]MBU2088948.1 hypothetical protein [Alphaproteobacteria bacterium]
MSDALRNRILDIQKEIRSVREQAQSHLSELSEIKEETRDFELQMTLGKLPQTIMGVLEDINGLLKSDSLLRETEAPRQLAEIQGLIAYLEAELAWTNNLFSQISSSTGRFLSWLAAWLGKIGRQIFALLQGLMTPKEWTLSGKVGTGLLGLADVELGITFGP